LQGLRVVGLAVALGLLAAPASAETVTEACVRASEEGQSARGRGALLAAHASFAACAATACPKAVRAECTRWLDEVDRDTPTIVVAMKDASGADVLDGRVSIDGAAPVAIDGRTAPVDPGKHVLRFERPGERTVERAIVVATGERNRLVVGQLEGPREKPLPPPPPPPPPQSQGLPAATWVFGGIGAFGLASFATLGALGLSEKSKLRGSCAPACTDSDVTTLRTLYIGADVSLAVGVVALGLAMYFALSDH
jgi:hypothetical protein